MPDNRLPFHVVHMLGSLKSGGVEKWLYEMQQHADPRRFRHTYIVSELTGSDLESRFIATGANICVCDIRQGLLPFGWNLHRAFRKLSPVDAVHSHVHAFSAINLLIAAAHGIPVRVAHSHTDRSSIDASASVLRKLYLLATKQLLSRVMTGGVAVSRSAADDLFGEESARVGNIRVVPCGVDLSRYSERDGQRALRRTLGISPSAKVLMHVGNFVEPKNHEFIVQVGSTLLRRRSDVRIVLVGSGPLEGRIRQLVKQSGLGASYLFLGSRTDVPELLLDVADAFFFPSLWEGLPVALIEAQAAGLPCIVSHRVTREADAPGAFVQRLSLEDDVSSWVGAIEAALAAGRHVGDLSGFSVSRSHEVVMSVYRLGAVGQSLERPCV